MELDENLEAWYERVVEATKMVAAPYSVQVTLFPKNLPIADEIALNFCDEVEYQIDYLLENELITDIQYEKIRQLGKKFSQMSSDKTQDYWSLESLQNSEQWGQCRKLAREILEIFDEKLVEDFE
ncbi:hypothetical protein [Clostridium sp. UBA4548]|uniref:hypothetical protein n=1 Tax=Clostridium sp. UBA4548 TaxID=1946361 RepID=UPI0025C15C93|nr:hypothetical protein [Clostridium sp. UBA4548]